MKFAVLERIFSPPLNAPITLDDWMRIHYTLDDCLEVRQVRWLYSLVSVTGDRSICLFQVPYTDTVRLLYRKFGMPVERVWQAALIQPMIESVGSLHTMA